jgi:chorismate mutase/prephenate dehydrogenase
VSRSEDPAWSPTSEQQSAPRPGSLGREEAQDRLSKLRERISEVDEQLIRIIGERRDLVLQVGQIKEVLELPVMDPAREAQVVRRAAERARELGVDEEMTRDVIWRIIAAARATQENGT